MYNAPGLNVLDESARAKIKIIFDNTKREGKLFLRTIKSANIIWKLTTFSRKCYIVTLLHCYNKVVSTFRDGI